MHIGSFLQKYKTLTPPHDSVRKEVIKIIEKEIGVILNPTHVRVVRTVVWIDTASHIKNTVFVKKEKLLILLTERLGKKVVTDIR